MKTLRILIEYGDYRMEDGGNMHLDAEKADVVMVHKRLEKLNENDFKTLGRQIMAALLRVREESREDSE